MPAPKDPKKRELWKENIRNGLTGKKRPPFSQEWRENMSKGRLGPKNHMFGKTGKKSPSFGKKRPAHAELMRQRMTGEKNPMFRGGNIHKICSVCGDDFEIKPSKKNQKCCSNECRGKVHSEMQTGKKRPDLIERMRGEKNPAYIDGKSKEPYSLEFARKLKEAIRLRDNYKCQKCGFSELEEGRKLSIHHIDYEKMNCEKNNLITLCLRCNNKVNINRKKWTRYFQKKVTTKYQQKQLYLLRL